MQFEIPKINDKYAHLAADTVRKNLDKIKEDITDILTSHSFENRYTLHPRKLKLIGEEEAEKFLKFLEKHDSTIPEKSGADRAEAGLRDTVILEIFDYLHSFLSQYIQKDALPASLTILKAYGKTYITSYNKKTEQKLIADQEQLRQALSTAISRQKQELLIKNHAIETSLNGILLADLEWNIMYANPALARMLDTKPENITKSTVENILSPLKTDDILKVLEETGAWHEEINYSKDDSTRDFFLAASLIKDRSSTAIGIMISFVDITEKKRLEAQFRQSQKMEALGKLAGGIAHDFNNILAAISGYAELQLLDSPEGSEHYTDMMEIKRATERGKGLTSQLLFFTRRASKEREPLNLNDIAEGTIQLLKRTFPPEITLLTSLDPNLKPINGNKSQLNQVLMNLCVNARDAMREKINDQKAVLEITTYNVMVDKEKAERTLGAFTGEYACIKIRDTGSGMAPSVVEHLFEPFFTTKAAGKGTGLGLSVVYGVVQGHEGFIDVHSTPGKGTLFSLYFPAISSDISFAASQNEDETLISGRGTILIVEDEAQVRYMEARTLEKCGYHVLNAANGIDAVSLYKQNRKEIDLVILDMVMPEMGGRECFYLLKNINTDIKIILVTGYTTDPLLMKEIKEKATGIIEKPFTLHEFTHVIYRALNPSVEKL
ncbi:MAG: hypothetical protein DRP57_13620 [Spirochaetes bacterium]|nr:MAG: hypothetical protein DRP57_13620 [Spirochaetota bacterium]